MRFATLVPLIALSMGTLLKADTLTYTVTTNSGQFNYDFALSNTGATGGTLFDLFLAIPTAIANINTSTIGKPVGWGDATGGLLFFGPDVSPSTSFIDWSADFSGTYDVGIGNSLSGFSFSSTQRISLPITFAVNGSTTFNTAHQAIPEPATFGMIVFAIAGIGVRSAVKIRPGASNLGG
jgi:hypothetical protein